MLVDADGRFLLADFDVSKDTGPEGVAKDGDGGGARAVEIERTLSDMETTRTSMAGTHGFMAPEVRGRFSVWRFFERGCFGFNRVEPDDLE